jgi:hypothetical protein
MQYYRRGSLARALSTLWYQDLTEVQRLRYGVQVRGPPHDNKLVFVAWQCSFILDIKNLHVH